MIKAKHYKIAVDFFDWYLTKIIRGHFKDIKVSLPDIETNKSILLISNHFSWWDGFFHVYVNKHYLHKRYHVMMLEEELAKRKVLRFAGSYSVNPKSKSIIETLRYTNEVLQEPKNLVLIFPQGKIESYTQPIVNFEKGALKIIDANSKNATILFCTISIEYHSNRKPTLYLDYTTYNAYEGGPQEVFNNFYKESRGKLL